MRGRKAEDPHFRCRIGRVPKYAWASIDEAWFGAWYLWAIGKSEALNPYRCNATRIYRADLRRQPHPNPWRWEPVMLVRILIVRANAREHPCGGWHLTRSSASILPPASRKALSSGRYLS